MTMEAAGKELSPKRRQILDFIRRFIRDNDYPPSIRDIQVGCQISSTSVVDYHLRALERLGYLRRRREVSRAIEILGRGGRPRTVSVPVIGTIAAGQPLPVPAADAWTNPEYDSIDLPLEMTGNREDVYALRVKGTSMIDALVNDGDIVVMAPAATAENGDMVAAWLKREGEATLKRFYREGERVRLQPANEAMAPIYTDIHNVEIQGRVISSLRPPPG